MSDQVAGATARGLAFEERDYGTPELLQIFSCGKTTLFTDILPQLETYYLGNRVKATGRSVKALRDRKLAEPRRSRQRPKNHHEKRRRRETGAP